MPSDSLVPSSDADLPALTHPWSHCITVGRGYELLRADLRDHLLFLKREFGYRYIRFHASFHDDVAVVHRLPDGERVYRWTQLDHIYDFLVESGFDPIVEINSMPKTLASGDQTMFGYNMNVTPPASLESWEAFLQAYITHTVERYGIERVRNWKFEVWNEPDLSGFWSGSMEDYYTLYASCARVLKGFDSSLQVGGPATADPGLALPFAEWCREHDVPVDFLTYHSYPQNEACKFESAKESPHAPGMHFVDVIRKTQGDLRQAGFQDLPLVMTEWNTQAQDEDWGVKWVGNPTCNTLFAGAAVCHLAHACDDALDIMGWWVASDVFEEGGPQVEPYGSRYQYYGMLTIDGIPKSSFHAFRFLNRLRGRRYSLDVSEEGSGNRGGVVSDEKSCTRALLWNCVFPTEQGAVWEVDIALPLPAELSDRDHIRVTCAQVTEGQGSAYEAWVGMGEPANLTRLEQEMLRARSEPCYRAGMFPVSEGRVRVTLSLQPNEFVLVEAGGDPAGSVKGISDDQADLDQSLMV